MPADQNNPNKDQFTHTKISHLLRESPGLGPGSAGATAPSSPPLPGYYLFVAVTDSWSPRQRS
jgi:hypothetical protein